MNCSRCGKVPTTGMLAFNMPNTDGVCLSCLRGAQQPAAACRHEVTHTVNARGSVVCQACGVIIDPKPARPVRVGDRIVWGTGLGNGHKVTEVLEDRIRVRIERAFGGDLTEGYYWREFATHSIRHADGAPIDVEATLAALRSTPKDKVAQLDEWVQYGIIDEPTRLKLLVVGGVTEMPASPGPMPSMADIEAEMAAIQKKIAGDTDRILYGPTVPLGIHEPLRADLDAARKRIAELEGRIEWAREDVHARREEAKRAHEQANRLSDQTGALRTERDDLLRENAVLRRKLEATERKAAKR